MAPYQQTYILAFRDILRLALLPDEWHAATPFSSTTTTVLFGHVTNIWPDSHWVGGSGRLRYNGQLHTRRIVAFDSATGLLTFAHPFPIAPPINELFFIIRANMTMPAIESAVRAAYERVGTHYLHPASIEFGLDATGDQYPLPTTWRSVYRVELDWSAFTRPELAVGAGGPQSERGVNGTTATQRVGQSIRTSGTPVFTKRVWLKLRKLGNPTGTLTLRIETTTNGLPTGAVLPYATTTFDASTVTRETSWHAFDFPDQVVLWGNQTYALTLQPSYPTSATNYVAWAVAENASVPGGSALVHNGSSWSTTDGAQMFRVQGPPEWRVLDRNRWSVARGPSPELIVRPIGARPDGMAIRVHGQRLPTIPTSDSDLIDIHPALLRDVAVAEILTRFARTDEEFRRAQAMEQRALVSLQQYRTLLHPEARVIEV